jgi:methylornithine synthase
LLISAVMRVVFPDRLIPASLDVDGLAGLKQRLEAGANVVTSIVPPGRGLAGIARHSLDIEEGKRTITSVKKVLQVCGLKPAGTEAYRCWITLRQKKLENGLNKSTFPFHSKEIFNLIRQWNF